MQVDEMPDNERPQKKASTSTTSRSASGTYVAYAFSLLFQRVGKLEVPAVKADSQAWAIVWLPRESVKRGSPAGIVTGHGLIAAVSQPGGDFAARLRGRDDAWKSGYPVLAQTVMIRGYDWQDVA